MAKLWKHEFLILVFGLILLNSIVVVCKLNDISFSKYIYYLKSSGFIVLTKGNKSDVIAVRLENYVEDDSSIKSIRSITQQVVILKKELKTADFDRSKAKISKLERKLVALNMKIMRELVEKGSLDYGILVGWEYMDEHFSWIFRILTLMSVASISSAILLFLFLASRVGARK